MKEDEITIASIEKRKEVGIDVGHKPQRGCCIYRVPKGLRKINEEAYTPKVISIGPLHHDKNELADMEKHKIRYKKKFSKRITDETWQELIHFVDLYEQSIRNCYEDRSCTFKLEKIDFITMILYDAVFIIELFLRNNGKMDFLSVAPHLTDIRSDLQLIENQLPFFVLNELYSLALLKPETRAKGYPSFFYLSCKFFFPRKQLSETDERIEEVKHFTDLRRHFMTTKMCQLQEHTGLTGLLTDVPCAVKLKESGVKFKCNEEGWSLDVSSKKIKKLCLEVLELQIPKIEVNGQTELLFRNVMALEQCHYPRDTQVCNFFGLMDFLVNTEADVDLLAEAGIMSNNLGDSTTVARMFNRLCLHINFSYSCYWADAEDLKTHYRKSWNHTIETLKSVYFSNLWRGTGTIAAFLLVLLTLIQTVCSILQVL
ncbi:hypothetical protein CUMW_238820 [Citrus unshiu]|uniref:Uncharacterized protein n=1 Tax=Citrus unshiu TaxID=55188 RepID=A0A2H5QKH3_CITUN|nr:hypothetical protein CUMW_238820 [Citrus unshiu]